MLIMGVPGLPRPGKRKPANRRGSVRFAPALEIVCYWRTVGDEFSRARVYNVSAGGVCLLIKRRISAGATLEIELINGPHTCRCTRTVHVLRVFQSRGHDTVIAGQFDRKLSYDELLPFVL